jgi:hypothetical protein
MRLYRQQPGQSRVNPLSQDNQNKAELVVELGEGELKKARRHSSSTSDASGLGIVLLPAHKSFSNAILCRDA